jgi:hypothetical protein
MKVAVELEPKHNEEMQSACFSQLTDMKPLRSESAILTCGAFACKAQVTANFTELTKISELHKTCCCLGVSCRILSLLQL